MNDDATYGSGDTEPSRYMNVDQAAAYLNTTVSHIRELVLTRRVPFYRVGKFIRFTSADLDAWMETNRTEPRHRLR